MSDILERICAVTRDHVATARLAMPFSELDRRARSADAPRGFARALEARHAEGRFGLIAELKRRSPSGGEIRSPFEPAELARAYQAGGAACLSILTDIAFFGGCNGDLAAARAAVDLPVLRKDFMIDPWQVTEARAIGADCILVIMAALDDTLAAEIAAAARGYGMDVLVEVHNRAELDRALALPSRLIGINNRDLKRLVTDLSTTEILAPLVPADRILVSESGLKTHADLKRMAAVGAHTFLVGESLLREPDLTEATRRLLGTLNS